MRILLGTILCMLLLAGCKSESDNNSLSSAAIYIGYDVTEANAQAPMFNHEKTLEAIDEIANISGQPSTGVYIKVFLINDLFLTDEFEFELGQGGTFENPLLRKKVSDKFLTKLESTVSSIDTISTGKKQTRLYLPVCKQLNDLAAKDADRKVMILFSDLLENSRSTSFYNKKLDVEQVHSQLAGECGLDTSVSGVSVQVVSTISAKNDAYVENAAIVWRSYFEKHGIEFKQTSNL